MTEQVPAPGPGVSAASDDHPWAGPPYVWTGQHWELAPPDFTPPTAWWPAGSGWHPAPPGWQPPPDWVRTSSGSFPPPRWEPQRQWVQPTHLMASPGPSGAARRFGWVRCLPGRLQRAAAAADRRPSGWEIVIMLAVFPAASVVAALISLGQTLDNYSDGSAHAPTIVPGHVVVSTALFVLLALTDFAPAALALYFLKLSGGGARAIGLDLASPRRDMARSAKLILYAFAGPILVVGGILGQFTPHSGLAGQDSTHLPVLYVIPFILSSIGAGVVEEIVVLGFLCHRLEQRGWNGWQLYAVLIAVRVSYHLYYGTAAIGFALWGGLSVLLYRRRRRLLTFIVAHTIWDSAAFISGYLHGGAVLLPFLVEIVLLVGLWLAGRDAAVTEMTESGRGMATGQTARPTPI